ncbi:glycosyltransferase involved in cell wall biosynthesis [Azospirillum picis]|uniref:Glycosyltransferase involved in cell wall biosynthesis n=1 Tax=Azospirillum picis TaxID=488438 RepID=A0ABU0MQH9_9PROT|nr:glycosyltransferase [Azospirillum picis]MBP2302155.1 glycosyltransferase involved in cell wall biosynthesis [Azospirillum picis]MDQ0535734.1 glycosyltransferase involved in cell wall biosynthesis [Azospirillum picis]
MPEAVLSSSAARSGARPSPTSGPAAAGGRPRVAVVVKGYPRLSETFIAQELLAFQERGIDLAIWSLRHPTDTRRHALHERITAPVHYLPEYLHDEPGRVLRALGTLAARRPLRLARAVAAWLRDLARDPTANRGRRFGQALVLAAELPRDVPFLYAHFLHTPASVARYAAAIRGIGWGFSAHAKDIWTTPDWEKREKLAEARFGATCTAVGAAHLRGLAAEPGRIDLVYHGLDLSRFPPPPDRAGGAARDGSAPDRAVEILSVGRLVEKKGYDRLLDALALLPPGLHWRLVHIGSGDLKPALRAQAERLGLAGRIDWRGAQDQATVIGALRQADLFALTSVVAGDGDRDGLPNVLMEAASQELAILSTPVSAIPEFIDDGVHGLLADGTPPGIADALSRLIADPALRLQLGEAARRRLCAEFGMTAGIDRLVRRLEEEVA